MVSLTDCLAGAVVMVENMDMASGIGGGGAAGG
jgi:hypothetical protein